MLVRIQLTAPVREWKPSLAILNAAWTAWNDAAKAQEAGAQASRLVYTKIKDYLDMSREESPAPAAAPLVSKGSTMDAYDQAVQLRREAEEVLKLIRLEELVRPYGPITPTGSYFLEVMAYPDIDVYIPEMTLKDIFQIAEGLAEVDEVKRVIFEKSHDPSLPGGLYLKPRVYVGNWGRPWKVDIWSVSPQTLQAKMADMHHYRERMTPELHERILLYKHSVMSADLRTPPLSGHWIYQAFIDEGLVEFTDVTEFLMRHGIKIY